MSSLGLSIHISHKVTCWGVSNSMWDMQFLLGLSWFKSVTGHSNRRLWYIDVLVYAGLRGCRQRHPPGGRLLAFDLGQFSDRYLLNELGCHANSLCRGNEITYFSSDSWTCFKSESGHSNRKLCFSLVDIQAGFLGMLTSASGQSDHILWLRQVVV